MSVSENALDPYKPPSLGQTTAIDNFDELSFPQRKMLKDFQTQSLALGVLWLFFPMLIVGIIGYRIHVDSLGWNDSPILAGLIFTVAFVFTITCTSGGIGTLLKKQWGLYLGLFASYLSIGFLGASTIVLTVIVIIQGHRVLNFMSQLKAAGIPLTTKPFSSQSKPANQRKHKDLQNLFE